MRILFIDTETTGLPVRTATTEDFSDVRLIQLGWVVVDSTKRGPVITSDANHVVKPEGFVVSNHAFHCVTPAQLAAGKPVKSVLDAFERVLSSVDLVVAHNADFDVGVLNAELQRAGRRSIATPTHCTMKIGPKWFRLVEMYHKWFGPDTFNAHDALEDAYACMRCYFKIEQGIDMGPHRK
jgi:DNA polymerase III epsilon subunit-like protein